MNLLFKYPRQLQTNLAEAWSSTESAGGRTIAQLQLKFKHKVGLNTVRENFALSRG